MKLYEVNRTIEELLLQLEPDPETGEVLVEVDEVIAQLEGLEMERSRILQYIAKLILNTRSDVASLKEEEKRLKDRRTVLERKEERLMSIMDRECAGQKTDCGVATMYYRKTDRVEIDDGTVAINYLTEHGYDHCVKVPAPEISKSEVKKLLKSGEEIPGAALVQDYSCSLR